MNKKWWGVYCSVNDFEATENEMKLKWVKTKRNIPFLKKINWAFADLDIAKNWDWKTLDEKSELRDNLFWKVYDKCKPSLIIETLNWIQPIRKLKDTNTTQEYQDRYVNVINWIIEWSKTVWASWDQVKDVTRILRVPWYYHMKWDPFLCKTIVEWDEIYTLEELEKIFLEYAPKKEEKKSYVETDIEKTWAYREIESLDFEEVMIRAFWSVWRSAMFDKNKRLILDGRLTWNFIGKKWDRRYIASTSHESFEWNMITSVATIQWCSYKDAFKRLVKEYNISTEQKTQVAIPEIEKAKIPEGFIFPNKAFDDLWCLQTWELITIVAEGHSGKTTFALDIIQANAKRGKRWFYINLEFPIETMWQWRWLFLNNKKKENMNDIAPMTTEERHSMNNYVQSKIAQFEHIDHAWGIGLDKLIKIIIEQAKKWIKLIVIDSLSKITIQNMSEYEFQKKIMVTLQKAVQNLDLAIILLHHTNKTWWDFAWTQKIFDDSNVFITISKEEDDELISFRKFTLSKDKITKVSSTNIYFINHDYISEEDYKWEDLF